MYFFNVFCNISYSFLTKERNSAYGYRNFMAISDITGTRNFVKHNSLMISIQVTGKWNCIWRCQFRSLFRCSFLCYRAAFCRKRKKIKNVKKFAAAWKETKFQLVQISSSSSKNDEVVTYMKEEVFNL